MTELSEIRTALAGALSNLPALNPGDKLRTYALIPDAMAPPCAVVLGPDIDFEIAFGIGPDLYDMKLVVYVGSPGAEAAQTLLDRYMAPMGEYSIKQALEDDPTLGGVVQHARCVGTKNYGIYEMNNARLLGTEFQIPVYAAGG